MRHGPAEDRSSTGRDFDRALTAAGREIVIRVGRDLRSWRGADLPRVLASPALRAQQTAELVRAVAAGGSSSIETREELAVDEPPALRLVEELEREGRDALLVGHQPAAEGLVRLLCDDASQLRAGFRTAMIVCVSGPAEARVIDRVLT